MITGQLIVDSIPYDNWCGYKGLTRFRDAAIIFDCFASNDPEISSPHSADI